MLTRVRAWIRVTFGFSRSEINGFLILLPLIVIILLSGTMARRWMANTPAQDTTYNHQLDSIVATWRWPSVNLPSTPVATLFEFDPNKATEGELVSLGIPQKVAARIINYRTKGGTFRTKSDFKKMHGLDSLLYLKLTPYLLLANTKTSASSTPLPKTLHSISKNHVKFDLNQADTTQLKSVFGIGTVRAARIVKFRDRLGGFVSLDQLREVYGLDSVVLDRLTERCFVTENYTPVTLSLNTATEQDLAAHPYFSRKLANAIVAYRFQHGPFQRIEDLQQIAILKEEVFNKIKPYLSLD
jgi:competence ComEA-like helix-hairpin-helix protein